jgi:hypothetical protein
MSQAGRFGKRLRAHLLGAGPQVIVLSHGFGTDQTAWEHVVPLLGHGASASILLPASTELRSDERERE